MKITLENARNEAEKLAYKYIRQWTQTEDGQNAFLGMIPDGCVNCLMFVAGGTYDREQVLNTYQEASVGNYWGTMRESARIEISNVDRATCNTIAGKVLNGLKDTTNLHNKGNIQWFRMYDYPSEPEGEPINDGKAILWKVTMDMELIYATATELD